MKMHDYLALAQAIKENTFRQYETDDLLIQAPQFLDALCDILKAENKNFDKTKFMEACK